MESSEGWQDEVTGPESKEQNRFMGIVNKMPGCYVIKIHGDRYSIGNPDLVGSYGGRAFAFEWKKGPKEPLRPLQRIKLKLWEKAFAITGVFWRAEDALATLANYKIPS